MSGRLRWLALVALAGCALTVQARGPVSPGDDGEPWIHGLNGKSRRLNPGRFEVLRHLDGEFVRLEGRLRRRAIDVDALSIEEGRTGLPAYLGFARVARDGEVFLDDPRSGGTHRLVGDVVDGVAEVAGEQVLVEGFVVGHLTLEITRFVAIPPRGHTAEGRDRRRSR